MFHIAYVSSAAGAFTKPQLRDLLARSRENNQRLEVTGLLLYQGGNFMQVLEGAEPVVRKLYLKICQDPRHNDIFTLFAEPLREREFPNWSMAFQDLELKGCRAIPGYSDFLSSGWSRAEGSTAGSKARKLLAGFKERLR